MSGKFTVFTGKNGETYFNLKAGNGEIILRSEGYKDRSGALNGIESVRKNAPDATRYEKKTSTNGKFHFSLKAANHQIIGTSEMYESESSRNAGIASVMANAADAKLVEG
ncbi:YegP family protein [Rhodanobacter lindaniclasticus]